MFIRCTTIKRTAAGKSYKTHRLVETERVGCKVKQCTLLNLGRHFDVPKSQWRDLASRITELLNSQGSLLGVVLEPDLEAKAQHYAAQILASRSACNSSRRAFTIAGLACAARWKTSSVSPCNCAARMVKPYTRAKPVAPNRISKAFMMR